MATNYPNSIDSYSTKTDNTNTKVNASHVNDLQDAMVAVENELGTNPSGSESTIKARLDKIETGTGVTNADKVDGYHANSGIVGDTIPVRASNGEIPGVGIATGTYTGNGAANRQIAVGFQPKLVWIYPIGSSANGEVRIDSLGSKYRSLTGSYTYLVNGATGVVINSNGFTTGDTATNTGSCNYNGVTYVWEALR